MEHAATTELPWLVPRQGRSWWLWLPAFVSPGVFAWLPSLHPSAAGRTYAACGGVCAGNTILR